MKGVCITDDYTYITYDKEYEIVRSREIEGVLHYEVVTDDGELNEYPHYSFAVVEKDKEEEECSVNTECNVLRPSHYQLKGLSGVEIKDVRQAILDGVENKTTAWSIDCWSRSWEYLSRMWSKHDNPLEDAKKAKVYLEWLIKELEK